MRRNILSGIPTRSAFYNLELVLVTLLCLVNSMSTNNSTTAYRNTGCLRPESWDLRMNDSNGLPGMMYWTQRQRWHEALEDFKKQNEPGMFYRYSSVLMSHVSTRCSAPRQSSPQFSAEDAESLCFVGKAMAPVSTQSPSPS